MKGGCLQNSQTWKDGMLDAIFVLMVCIRTAFAACIQHTVEALNLISWATPAAPYIPVICDPRGNTSNKSCINRLGQWNKLPT